MPDSLLFCGLNRIFGKVSVEQNTKEKLVFDKIKKRFHQFNPDGCIAKIGESQFVCTDSCPFSLGEEANTRYRKPF